MADSKISALPASTTPLAGTEVLPIVQSSTTRQVSVANLTTGRAISATQLTLTTGNLIVASGQGIDFSATPGTGTSELLADYEEGTWTPVLTPASGTITPNTDYTGGTYTRIGNLVTVNGCVYVTSVSSPTGTLTITGLPFASKAGTTEYRAGSVFATDLNATATQPIMVGMVPDTFILIISILVVGVATAMATDVKAASDIRFSITYQV
jgi:hypothetical protein